MSGAAAPEPLHARVAGLLERAFNPILVKELRGSLRGNRFFAAHLTVLGLFAGGLLIALGVSLADARWENPDPAEIGRAVLFVTQALQLGVVVLVVPGLAATSITTEREGLTHDLLVTTGMNARQIVWGKFSAGMVQTFTLLVSMLPLVGLCFLFGGVTVYQIAVNHVFLLGLSSLAVSFALFASANSPSTQRAVGGVYIAALLAAIAVVLAWTAGSRSEILGALLETWGFAAQLPIARSGTIDFAGRFLYAVAVPLYLGTTLFALFFLGAVNRLKPSFSNRSTNLRLFAAVASFAGLALVAVCYRRELGPESSVRERSESLAAFAVGLLPLAVLYSLFGAEEPRPPAHLRAVRLPALLRPGAGPGAAFAAALAAALAVAAAFAFRPLTAGFDRGSWAGLPSVYPLALALGAVVLWTVFCATLARLLSCAWPDRPLLVRTLLVIAAVLVAVGPLVHWGLALEIARDRVDPQRLKGPWSLMFSPAAAVLAALDLSQFRRDFPLLCLGAPIPALFAVFAGTSATLFHAAATRLLRRRGPAEV